MNTEAIRVQAEDNTQPILTWAMIDTRDKKIKEQQKMLAEVRADLRREKQNVLNLRTRIVQMKGSA